MNRVKLTDTEIAKGLSELPGWAEANGKLHREYRFKDFVHAFGFMATCATGIEARNHHPEWFLQTLSGGFQGDSEFSRCSVSDRLSIEVFTFGESEVNYSPLA